MLHKTALLGALKAEDLIKSSEHVTTHTKTLENKLKLDVLKLIQLSQKLPTEKIRIDQLKGVTKSKRTGFSQERFDNADTQYPLLVNRHNLLLDGRHRALKLRGQGKDEADVRRISCELMDKATV